MATSIDIQKSRKRQLSLVKHLIINEKLFEFLRFICGETIFLFTLTSLSKNEEFLIGHNSQIRTFLIENGKQFKLRFGGENFVRLAEILTELKQSQIYFDH